MRIQVIILGLMIVTAISSCKKDSESICADGKIKDYTSQLDGCGILIELDNGSRIMPVEIPPGTSLINNKRVSVCYTSKPVMNVCMAGETVKITKLIYLP